MTTMLFSKEQKIVLNKYHHHHLWLQRSCRWNRHSEEQPAEIIIL